MTVTRWVVGDIHGCSKTFKALVKDRICLQKSDTLYLLGDYIDRGPDSKGVLEYIFELQENGYQLFPLRGNHEQYAIEILEKWNPETLHQITVPSSKNYMALLTPNLQPKSEYLTFFKSLPFYFDLGDFILVHAGIKYESSEPFEEKMAMTELKRTVPNFDILGNKKIIVGHAVTAKEDIIRMVHQRETVINIDNGCAYVKPHKRYDVSKLGNLCALNLDNFELIFQPNIETEEF